MEQNLAHIEDLRNAAAQLLKTADESAIKRAIRSFTQENGASDTESKTPKPRAKGQGDYPSYLYVPIKRYLTENGCHWETGKQVWFQIAALEGALRDSGILKPADGASELQYVLTKNGGKQNAFVESGGLWGLRRYLKSENRKQLKQAA